MAVWKKLKSKVIDKAVDFSDKVVDSTMNVLDVVRDLMNISKRNRPDDSDGEEEALPKYCNELRQVLTQEFEVPQETINSEDRIVSEAKKQLEQLNKEQTRHTAKKMWIEYLRKSMNSETSPLAFLERVADPEFTGNSSIYLEYFKDQIKQIQEVEKKLKQSPAEPLSVPDEKLAAELIKMKVFLSNRQTISSEYEGIFSKAKEVCQKLGQEPETMSGDDLRCLLRTVGDTEMTKAFREALVQRYPSLFGN